MAQTLKMAAMALYEPSPMRLMAIQNMTLSQTAMIGVPVNLLILYQYFEPGSISSRESAQIVLALACRAVIPIMSVIAVDATRILTSEVEDDECENCEDETTCLTHDVVEDLRNWLSHW